MSEGTGPQAHQDEAEGLGGPKEAVEYPMPHGGPPCTTHFSGCDCREAAWDAERRHRDVREAELLRRATGAEAEAVRWRDLFGRAQGRWCAEQARAARAEADLKYATRIADKRLEWMDKLLHRASVAETTVRDLYALVDARTALLETCAAKRAALAARVAELEARVAAAGGGRTVTDVYVLSWSADDGEHGVEAVFPTAEAAMQRANADVGETLAWHALGDVLYVAETPIGSSYVVERAELMAENGQG